MCLKNKINKPIVNFIISKEKKHAIPDVFAEEFVNLLVLEMQELFNQGRKKFDIPLASEYVFNLMRVKLKKGYIDSILITDANKCYDIVLPNGKIAKDAPKVDLNKNIFSSIRYMMDLI